MLKKILCFLILLSASFSFYLGPECPTQCICSPSFTDCKYNHFLDLPSEIDPNVTVLDLSYNDFQVFPDRLNFYPSLISLNLSYNKIQSLGGRTFRNLENLQRLDLSNNYFKSCLRIDSNTFISTKNLDFLDLSFNPIGSCPKERNPIQSTSLTILKLNNCSIEYLGNKFLSKLPKLHELHLSGNPIKFLANNFVSNSLKFLDLSKCELQFITNSVFASLTALQTIYMSNNYNLKQFNCNSKSLLYLDLSNCNLEVIPSGFLPNLHEANFHGNHFRLIPKSSFNNYSRLKKLDLSYNAISNIEDEAFNGLTEITEIDLSENTLSKLSSEIFENNSNLEKINLSRNYFSKVLDLVSDSLEILDLSFCEIHVIDYDCLINMPNLKKLNLSKNVISVLPDNWPANNLVDLDVSLCRIKNLNNRTFASMPTLRRINMSGNRLTSASPESFAQVISLDISDNPWRCDCENLKPFYNWLSKTGKRTDGLYCQSPEKYEGKSWISACQKDWFPSLNDNNSVWWYTVGLIVIVFLILFVIIIMRRMHLLKEKRLRQQDIARRSEEREALRRMQRMQAEALQEENRNAPDPRELQTPPSYNEALLLPRLDSSHPSLFGSLHSIASKHSINGSNPDLSKRRRPRRKRRRRKSDSSEGQCASQVIVEPDTSDSEHPQPRTTLESDI